MIKLNTWKNGERANVVKQIIDDNFSSLEDAIVQINNPYVMEFEISDWSDGIISIPYSLYKRADPIVGVYAKFNDYYTDVIGGFKITNSGVVLLSDIAYKGKVVIK